MSKLQIYSTTTNGSRQLRVETEGKYPSVNEQCKDSHSFNSRFLDVDRHENLLFS